MFIDTDAGDREDDEVRQSKLVVPETVRWAMHKTRIRHDIGLSEQLARLVETETWEQIVRDPDPVDDDADREPVKVRLPVDVYEQMWRAKIMQQVDLADQVTLLVRSDDYPDVLLED